jgi:hypothetical protein
VLFCVRCADVQPILLDEGVTPPAPALRRRTARRAITPEPPESTPEELESVIAQLRAAAGIQTEFPLGARHAYTGDLEADTDALIHQSNERTTPRVPVAEGFAGDGYDDALPDAGL